MDRLRTGWHITFFAAPIMAAAIGYCYQGWLGALVYQIAALALVGFVLVGLLIVSAWVKFVADRTRISRLSTEQLQLIVGKPANSSFRFAFAELEMRGTDLENVQDSLITMLASNDSRERDLGLERLREIHPELHSSVNASVEDSPGELQARVQSILELDGKCEH